MAVFTEVTKQQVSDLLANLAIGEFKQLIGIEAGIENSNFFLTTTQGEYILTIFERLTKQELPFYLNLMRHLALKNIQVPAPQADVHGNILFSINNKPCAVVNKLAGSSQLQPTAEHCHIIGTNLAKMHLAALDFPHQQANLRGLAWWQQTVPQVLAFLTPDQQQLLTTELTFQTHLSQTADYLSLTKAAVHCDLFRDNVLFTHDKYGQPQLGGFFDFYFAGYDSLLFDLAVCLNDWAIEHNTKTANLANQDALLQSYNAIRPLTANEINLLPLMLRAAALRFWLSRLWDFYLPRDAKMLTAHDPTHFEKILLYRRQYVYPNH